VGGLSGLSQIISGNQVSSTFSSDYVGIYAAKLYGMALDGTTDDYAALYALINTTIAGADAEIWFKDGAALIGSNITIPSNVKLKFLNGGMLKPASGKVVTGSRAKIEAGLHQIFDLSASGSSGFAGTWNVESWNPEWFGAVGGGSTECSTEWQYLLDYCEAQSSVTVNGVSMVPIINVNDLYLINTKLTIDRPENQTSFLRIVGKGTVGGFVTTSAIRIFGTNYVGSNQSTPASSVLSNQISFEGLTFSSTSTSAEAIDVKSYVRTIIKGCFFDGIKLNASDGNDYVQSCYISGCFARGVTGKWLDALDMYDVRVNGECLFEQISDTVIYAGGTVNGAVFGESLVQSCGNLYVNIGTAYGVEISGCYAEANVGRFAKIDNAYGVTIYGNEIATRAGTPDNTADATFFEIYIGESYNFVGFGNRFSHRGYQFEGTSKVATVGAGDYAGTQLIRDYSSITNTSYGDLTQGGSITVYGGNASGTDAILELQNTGTGFSTENLIKFIHQTTAKAGIRTTLTNDASGSGNIIFETLNASATYAERARLNYLALTLAAGVDIITNTGTGTKLGTAANQKVGFWGQSAVVQPTAVADATGAGDVVAQLNALLAKLRTIGIIAT
jgi:hypothetical protein